MKRLFLLLLSFAIIAPCLAQEESKPIVKFSGLVKSDFFYDTRQSVSARDRHFLLWPEPIKLDGAGKDLNARGSFNFLAVQSKAGVSVSGIEYKGIKISAVLEGDFFGQANENVNSLRLRHAIVKLNWENSELIMGQYWNPLFTLDCYPGTVSFNTGVPFIPFARNPQARFTRKVGHLKFMVAAVGQQKEYTSLGGSEALRNAGIPDMHAQMHLNLANDHGTEFVTGVGGSYKTILPSLITAKGFKTDETVSSLSFIGFMKLKVPILTAKMQGVLGENLYDVVQISSYAIKRVVDPEKEIVSYTPIKNYSLWCDLHTNSKVQLGVFGGYSKNLGTSEEIVSVPASRSHNIDYLYRISPRLVIPCGKLNFGLEVEHTAAAYGTIGEKAKVENSIKVKNTRFLFSSYVSF